VLDGKLRLILLKRMGEAAVRADFSHAHLHQCLAEFTTQPKLAATQAAENL